MTTTTSSTPNASPLAYIRRTLSSNWFFLLVAIFLIVFPHMVGQMTGTSPFARRGLAVFWQSIMIELLIIAMLTMSYNLMFGFTGVTSFGHALFFGLGGYMLGGFLRADPTNGLGLGVLAGIAVAAVLGFFIGLVSLRLKGVYFAMFTLAIAEMVFIFFISYQPTGGEDGFALSNIPEWLNTSRYRINLYYLTVVIFVAMFLFIRRLMLSPTGAVLLGIRENENRAKAIGYNTLIYKLLAITIAGVLATVSGMLFALLNATVSPAMLSVDFTVNPLLMTIIGGVGTFSGPVIGAVGLRFMDRAFRDSSLMIGSTVIDIGQSWTLILGVIFVVVVIVFPQGVVGTYNRLVPRIRAMFRRKPTQTS